MCWSYLKKVKLGEVDNYLHRSIEVRAKGIIKSFCQAWNILRTIKFHPVLISVEDELWWSASIIIIIDHICCSTTQRLKKKRSTLRQALYKHRLPDNLCFEEFTAKIKRAWSWRMECKTLHNNQITIADKALVALFNFFFLKSEEYS